VGRGHASLLNNLDTWQCKTFGSIGHLLVLMYSPTQQDAARAAEALVAPQADEVQVGDAIPLKLERKDGNTPAPAPAPASDGKVEAAAEPKGGDVEEGKAEAGKDATQDGKADKSEAGKDDKSGAGTYTLPAAVTSWQGRQVAATASQGKAGGGKGEVEVDGGAAARATGSIIVLYHRPSTLYQVC
jgi:hypothetical protein